MDELSQEQKEKLRLDIANEASKLIGIKYVYGAEWTDYTQLPDALDCSELVEGVYKIVGLRMDDGSQAQYNMTVPSPEPRLSDLAFFGKGGDPSKIYHVGLVYHMSLILEARAFDPNVKFETGRVILRPLDAWVKYKNWVGFRSHPKLL